MVTQEKLTNVKRKYFPEDFQVNRWKTIKKSFESLLSTPIKSVNDLEFLIKKSGEGVQILFDHRNRLFIQMKSKSSLLNYLKYLLFQRRIISKGLHYHHQWENKVLESPYKQFLDPSYNHFFKILEHQKKMYVPQNVKLIGKEERLSNRYNYIASRISSSFEGKKMTTAQLERMLSDVDRGKRHEAFLALSQAYMGVEQKLNKLFDQLVDIRHSIALNANYTNYRDFAHDAKARFSYSIEDVLNFHQVVEKNIAPLLREMNQKTAQLLQLKELKPWDSKMTSASNEIPYKEVGELIDKSVCAIFDIKPEYGIHLKQMANTSLLDLFNRPKKGPGAFNIPLFEMGSSYIFTNFVENKVNFQNMAILHHEFGHALHNYFTTNETTMAYRNFPSEISELASMTMELLALEHLHHYYSDMQTIEEAKKQQFKRFIQMIVSRCQGDAYQHWVYTHPGHTQEARNQSYIKSMKRFDDGISWKGIENYQHLESLKVLHFFQVPFYYIEYAFAALGAIDIYRQYKINPSETLKKYESFLKAGYNKDVHLLYQEAGTKFDFSENRVKELMDFVRQEIKM